MGNTAALPRMIPGENQRVAQRHTDFLTCVKSQVHAPTFYENFFEILNFIPPMAVILQEPRSNALTE